MSTSTVVQLMCCGSQCEPLVGRILADIRRQIVHVVGGATVPRPSVPVRYVDWVDSMIAEGNAVFRIFAILVHMQYDDAFRTRMMLGVRADAALEFMESLQDRLNDALIGRNPDGSCLSAVELSAARFKRVPRIVSAMQDFLLAL
jgi:hypothetical protein